jgi:hypothetical protein
MFLPSLSLAYSPQISSQREIWAWDNDPYTCAKAYTIYSKINYERLLKYEKIQVIM